MPFGYTLNFDIVTDAASCGFLVLACIWLHLVTDALSCGFLALACIWLHLVSDAASRGFPVLAPFDPPIPKTQP